MHQLVHAVRRRIFPSRPLTPTTVAEKIAPIPEPFRSRLRSMYAGEPQAGIDGLAHPLDSITRISPDMVTWIYELCVAQRPTHTLEIGLGYGFSALGFLGAIAANQSGHHTAIDAFQRCDLFSGIGLTHAGLLEGDRFRCLEEFSSAALVKLADERRSFEIVLIDGGHHFDTVLMDFTLSAALCPVGGYILFDDMWMPAIRAVHSFIRTNRTDFRLMPSPIANMAG